MSLIHGSLKLVMTPDEPSSDELYDLRAGADYRWEVEH
jgi:hypothetical protein